MIHRALRCLLLALFLPLPAAAAEIRHYELTFTSEWNFTTHPGAFPGGAHFTNLIGGTHNASARFWQVGGFSTLGLEAMAERGQVTPLDTEVLAAITAGSAWSVVQVPGVVTTPATSSGTFPVNSDFPLLTITSMIAPSPDWFVGVDSLPLYEDGQWKPVLTIDLYPYDSGTDSGVFFDSPNADTQPREPISALTGSPFAGQPRLGTLTLTLVPEPGGWQLAAAGGGVLAGLASWRRLRR